MQLAKLQSFFFPIDGNVADISPTLGEKWLIIGEAIELVHAASSSDRLSPLSIHMAATGQFRRLDDRFRGLRDEWEKWHAGERSDRKISLHGYIVSSDAPSKILTTVDETEWAEVQPIHEALRSETGNALRAHLWRSYLDSSAIWPIPNILSIHGIIETSDNMLVIAQRGNLVSYHPGHWSASFEEQVEPSDLTWGANAFSAAAARGVNEEFPFTEAITYSNCRILALLMERRILNPAVVAYVRLPFDSRSLLAACHEFPVEHSEFAPGAVHCVPFRLGVLSQLLLSDACTLGGTGPTGVAWHPTSRYRLLVAMLHRFGERDTLAALVQSIT